MNHQLFAFNVIIFFMSLFAIIPVLTVCANASHTQEAPDSQGELKVITDMDISKQYYATLKDLGFMNNSIDFENFDTIFVLTKQMADSYENVSQNLLLSMIAYESNFNKNSHSDGGAVGLMQLIPIFQGARMKQFVEDDHVISLEDYYNPRYNIAVGADYINYILSETHDLAFGLMWYNQGALSASESYEENHIVSPYARSIMTLKKTLDSLPSL